MFIEVVSADDARKNIKTYELNRIEEARKFLTEEHPELGGVLLSAIYNASIQGKHYVRVDTSEVFIKYTNEQVARAVECLIILGFKVNDHRLYNNVTLYLTSNTKYIDISC